MQRLLAVKALFFTSPDDHIQRANAQSILSRKLPLDDSKISWFELYINSACQLMQFPDRLEGKMLLCELVPHNKLLNFIFTTRELHTAFSGSVVVKYFLFYF